ncbi:patatin-like phospholipase family protein [Coleofasciculus sp. H7-2]|uniref:patatin-like phospholipase family protein n=1 Tax=Coleofasciculus sp. H7-2 TaxID=3351545 RepID=UPI00366DA3BB
MAKFRILSIDGGGIRGIIPGTILLTLEQKIIQRTGNADAKISDYFDFIAGTSTGGILSCLYLLPGQTSDPTQPRPRITAKSALDIYLENGNRVFATDRYQRLRSGDGILDEKYSAANLEKLILDYCQDTKLSQLLKPCLITSYDIKRGKPQFFTQHDARELGDSNDFYVKDVARATSAAPTFFEVTNTQSLSGVSYPLVDGGVFANNPTLCAYAEVHAKFLKTPKGFVQKKHLSSKGEQAKDVSEISAKDLLILSLGTGRTALNYEYKQAKNWGAAEWVRPVIDIMMLGVSQTVDYQLQQIYDCINQPKSYLRIDPLLPKPKTMVQMDNSTPQNVQDLKELGVETVEQNSEKLDDFLELLLKEAQG